MRHGVTRCGVRGWRADVTTNTDGRYNVKCIGVFPTEGEARAAFAAHSLASLPVTNPNGIVLLPAEPIDKV